MPTNPLQSSGARTINRMSPEAIMVLEAILEKVPSHVRNKKRADISNCFLNIAPTLQQILTHVREGRFLSTTGRECVINEYEVPAFFVELVNASVVYINASAFKKATPVFEYHGDIFKVFSDVKRTELYTDEDGKQKTREFVDSTELTRILTPEEFRDEFDKIFDDKWSFPLVKLESKRGVILTELCAYYVGDKFVLANSSGSVSEYAVQFIKTSLPFDPRYFSASDEWDNSEVKLWIKNSFSRNIPAEG